MSINIVKRLNKNVDLIDNNTGYTYISMSPDIADIRVVNQAIKITQRNGNVEFIENSDVNAIYVEPNAPAFWASNVYDLLLELSQNYFYCCSASSTPPTPIAMKYGSYFDTTTQTLPAGTIGLMQYNNIDFQDGVTIGTDMLSRPNRIIMSEVGVYNIQFSAQIVRTSGGGDEIINIFFRKNGLDIPSSNTIISLKSNNSFIVASWNYFVRHTNVNDWYEIAWVYDLNTVELRSEIPTLLAPLTPSVILTVNQIA